MTRCLLTLEFILLLTAAGCHKVDKSAVRPTNFVEPPKDPPSGMRVGTDGTPATQPVRSR